VKATDGRITAKRLLPVACGRLHGSARTFRRAVAAQKALWRKHRRVYLPWVPECGQHLLIDYGTVISWLNAGMKRTARCPTLGGRSGHVTLAIRTRGWQQPSR
jgi:hypothetical protein